MSHNGIALAGACAVLLLGVCSALAATESDQAAIRDLRARYNQVIEQRRPERFAEFLSPTFTEMISNGDVARGPTAVADSYAADEFRNPAFIAYDRQPDTVTVSPSGRTAVERGHWRARFRGPGGAEEGATGLYQAGWVKTDGGWRIQTEAYVRLTCTHEGAAC